MSDERKWIRQIRRETPPDLWGDVERRAEAGPRPGEPERRPLRTALVLIVSLAVVGSALYALRGLGGEGGTTVATSTTSASSGPSEVDPAAVCALPAYEPSVALLVGQPTIQVPLSVLGEPGSPAASIDTTGGDALREYLASPAAVHAPSDGWRPVVTSADAVTFAAPWEAAQPEWWVVGFERQPDGTWKRVEEEIVAQEQTPAQRGHGLELRWTGDLVLQSGAWNAPLRLVDGRTTTWTDPSSAFVAVPHVFDADGTQVAAGASVPVRADGSRLDPGAELPVPVALGAALGDLQPGTYRVVTCVPDLALASIGTLRVVDLASVPGVQVLTYPFDGTSMSALGGGTLVVTNGCLAVSTSGQRSIYVLWPDGYAMVERDGRPVLIDQIGRVVAALGDDVTLGGGYASIGNASNPLMDRIPEACRSGGGYFVTSGPA